MDLYFPAHIDLPIKKCIFCFKIILSTIENCDIYLGQRKIENFGSLLVNVIIIIIIFYYHFHSEC